MRFLRARQGEQPQSVRLCKWCGKPIEIFRWKDGRNFYCSSRCLSAGLFPAWVFGSVFLTPFLIATITVPDAVFYLVWVGTGGGEWVYPIEDISPLVSFMVWGTIAVICVSSVFFLYMAFSGWRTRREIRLEQDAESPVL